MLFSDNTKNVINLTRIYRDLIEVDKVRLAINILENLKFTTNYDVNDFINLLKEILSKLEPNYNKFIVNISKFKYLSLILSKYLELSVNEKKAFTIEMLFNIYMTDFKDALINKIINNRLYVYNYCYSIIN